MWHHGHIESKMGIVVDVPQRSPALSLLGFHSISKRLLFPFVNPLLFVVSLNPPFCAHTQARATSVPRRTSTKRLTTRRTSTPTGRWTSRRQLARRTCSRWRRGLPVSPARARTLCGPSWWRWCVAVWSRARPCACCSTRRRRTPSSRCWPISPRPSSWRAAWSRGFTHWMASRCVAALTPVKSAN